jgi:hypothetical protein
LLTWRNNNLNPAVRHDPVNENRRIDRLASSRGDPARYQHNAGIEVNSPYQSIAKPVYAFAQPLPQRAMPNQAINRNS